MCSSIEVVITGLTRNQFAGNRTGVRIPPAASMKTASGPERPGKQHTRQILEAERFDAPLLFCADAGRHPGAPEKNKPISAFPLAWNANSAISGTCYSPFHWPGIGTMPSQAHAIHLSIGLELGLSRLRHMLFTFPLAWNAGPAISGTCFAPFHWPGMRVLPFQAHAIHLSIGLELGLCRPRHMIHAFSIENTKKIQKNSHFNTSEVFSHFRTFIIAYIAGRPFLLPVDSECRLRYNLTRVGKTAFNSCIFVFSRGWQGMQLSGRIHGLFRIKFYQ